jgi:adenylate kinase family enzyme
VYVCGGPGSGKTTFATALAHRTGTAAHHLDNIARVGGGSGPETTADERQAAIDNILGQNAWIAEGVHLGWTQPLLDSAEAIVWLDHVAWHRSSGRIMRRFVSGALAEMRRRKGRERFLRFRDYARRLRELASAVPETRTYPFDELERALAPFADKVVRCRTQDDVTAALESLAGDAA